MRTSPTIIVNTGFVHWPKEMHPGHCFLWFKPRENLTFYSIVLPTEPRLQSIGYRRTRTFGGPHRGLDGYVPQDLAVILLSREQMDLAQSLGWPQDNETLQRVFSVPPS